MTNHYTSKFLLKQCFAISILLQLLLFSNNKLTAQVATTYTFSSSTSGNYTPLVGGTKLFVFNDPITGGNTDDDNSYFIPIGFQFYYNGVSFPNAWVNSNGYVKLAGIDNPPLYSYAYAAGAALTYEPNTIAAFAMDLMGQGKTDGTSEISYALQGIAPYRTCIIQFQNYSIYPGDINTASEKYNFQIRLHENNGLGYPEIIYGSFTSAVTGSVQVGITGSALVPGTPPTATDFNIRQGSWIASTAWPANTTTSTMAVSPGVLPSPGLSYKWETTSKLMQIDSISTKGISTTIDVGETDAPIMAAIVHVKYDSVPRFITEMSFNTTGTTAVSDIDAVKVYYTKTYSSFSLANATQFGSSYYSPSSGVLTFYGYEYLHPGDNYFWLVYDVSVNATIGNKLDAVFVSLLDSGLNTITATNASPNGSRSIVHRLNGNYTIDANGSGPNNFVHIDSALKALQDFGISGPVHFSIAAGTYTLSSTLNINNFIGHSSTNSVVFEGANKLTTIFTGNIPSNPLIRINGCSYVSFKNLTITNSATGSCAGVVILGSSNSRMGTGTRINNCIINLPNVGTSTSCAIGLTVDPTGLSYNTSILMDSIVIDSNQINGGYWGITTFGALNITYNLGFKFDNNTFKNNYNMAIHIQYVMNTLEITNNVITNNGSGSGIYLFRCEGMFSSHLIQSNRISGFTSYGIYLTSTVSPLPMVSRIYNNFIHSEATSTNCLYVSLVNPSPIEIYHNTLIYGGNTTTVTSGPLRTVGSPYIKIKNNILVNTSSTTTNNAAHIATAPMATNDINYNVYFNKNTLNTNLINIAGTQFTPLNYKTTTAGGDSSFNTMPPFDEQYKLTHPCSPKSKLFITALPNDINNTPRNTQPLIGCEEVISKNIDLSVDSITLPNASFTPGFSDVGVRVKNLGLTTLSVFDVSYIHNNNPAVTTLGMQVLEQCDTHTVFFTGAQQASLVGQNLFKAYTSNPNMMPDDDLTNDTTTSNLYGPLSGNYTIANNNSANFRSIKEAISTLKLVGVAGPVSFDVAPGTYSGQVIIDGVINGVSDTTPVVFSGANASTTIISANINQQATLIIDKVSYITFRNFTVNNTNSTNPVGIGIVGSTTTRDGRGCKIKNCIVNINTSSPSNISYGITVSSSAYGYGYTTNTRVDSIEIDSNTVNGAYYGITIRGASDILVNFRNTVRNNTINNGYLYGIYVYGHNNKFDLIGNTVNLIAPFTTANYGIYFGYNQNSVATSAGHIITHNKIFGARNYGLYLGYNSSPSASPALISNNLIIGGGNATSIGIYLYTNIANANFKVYHNTSLITNSNNVTTSYAMQYYNTSATSTVQDIKNNLLGIITTKGGNAYPLYFSNNPTALANNFNTYINNTSNQIVYRSATYNTTNYKTANAGGLNSSLTTNNFIDLTSGEISNRCLVGTNLNSDVPNDINGVTRSVTPSVGAIEYVSVGIDLSIDEVLTLGTFTTSPQNLTVRVRNNGSSTLTSLSINYVLNNGSVVNEQWSGNLTPCSSVDVIFTGAKQIAFTGGLNLLNVYSSNPNGTLDLNTENDTVKLSFKAPLNGTYVIGTSPSDYLNFASAISDLKEFGVAGPVIFDVKNGTYNERLYIDLIKGSSTTNTVTFKSQTNNASNVIITYPTDAITTATIILENLQNVKFQHLTVNATGATNARCFELVTDATNIDITNCNINVPLLNTTSTLYAGIFATGITGSNFNIKDNVFSNGAHSLYVRGTSTTNLYNNLIIENNVFNNAYYQTIYLYYTSNTNVIANTITGHTTYTAHYGIYSYYGDNEMKILNNKINIPSGGYGISQFYSDGTNTLRGLIANNTIVIGGTSTSYGLNLNYNSYQNVYNNSINITNSSTASRAGYFYYSSAAYNYNNILNNIFNNSGSGNAVYNYDPIIGVNNTWNYNLLKTNGAIIYNVGTPAATYATLNDWKVASNLHDKNSIEAKFPFTSATNLTPNLSDTNIWYANGRGIQISNNNLDIDNNTRSTTLIAGAPDIGAYEFTPTALAPIATVIPATPSPGTTQVFLYNADTIASITWNPFYNVPTSIDARFYGGVYRTGVSPNVNHVANAYWDFNVVPGYYMFDIKLYYKENMLGSVPNESSLIGAQESTTISPWTIYDMNSTVNTTDNTITITGLTDFTPFTGTTSTNPVPVKLSAFNATLINKDVIVSWSTASEKNSSHFIIEVSVDGKKFVEAGKVKAVGNSNNLIKYNFIHHNAQNCLNGASQAYYRLKNVDVDNTTSNSNIIVIEFNENKNVLDATTVYPNPFSNKITLQIPSLNKATAAIEILDIHGKVISNMNKSVEPGINSLDIDNMTNLQMGVYMVKISVDGESKTFKLIKN
jgi:hypothetical protein